MRAEWLRRLRELSSSFLPVALMCLFLLVSLSMLEEATRNTTQFGRLHVALVLINIIGLAVMVGLIGNHLLQVVAQFRRGAIGSRLTLRLVLLFIVLAVVPVSVVYYFSLGFLQRGIDSWFQVHSEASMEDALDLSRASLDLRLRELLRQTRLQAGTLSYVPERAVAFTLDDLRVQSGATDMTLLTAAGRVLASSRAETTAIIPVRPEDSVLAQAREQQGYVGLLPSTDAGLLARVAVPVDSLDPSAERRVLYAIYPVGERISQLADKVQANYGEYKELAYLREPLKNSFTMTLSLVLLVSVLAAVWAAFFLARRLVAPIGALAAGTRAVAEGIYDRKLPESSPDELGMLVRSFNDMTSRIAQARDDVRSSQRQADRERAYLRAVLGRLSSGVLTLDRRYTLRAVNSAASHILGVDIDQLMGQTLYAIRENQPHLGAFVEALLPHLGEDISDWREEVRVQGREGRRVLMCQGATLPGVEDMPAGFVVVFDDVTALIQVQRDAAWGEVARRLAHEIRNPLTPIQLSAERLRHKYLGRMAPEDAEVLDRATHTIVQQVQAMKEMVRAFSEYARTPTLELRPVQLADVVEEVIELYRGHGGGLQLELQRDARLPRVEADADRIRQLLHNLLKNAMEATSGRPDARIVVRVVASGTPADPAVELSVRDNGAGIPGELLDTLFEPYVTTKVKGSGIGLAVVKRIVEEHAGHVWAENVTDGGARLTVRFRALSEAVDAGMPTEQQQLRSSL